jgi:hypothetical protein
MTIAILVGTMGGMLIAVPPQPQRKLPGAVTRSYNDLASHR